MNRPIAYVREVLSNYTDRSDTAEKLFRKMSHHDDSNEETFVRTLSQEEVDFLNNILPEEIQHANNEQDAKRAHNLNQIYERLI